MILPRTQYPQMRVCVKIARRNYTIEQNFHTGFSRLTLILNGLAFGTAVATCDGAWRCDRTSPRYPVTHPGLPQSAGVHCSIVQEHGEVSQSKGNGQWPLSPD
jgi:hypothetical protein